MLSRSALSRGQRRDRARRQYAGGAAGATCRRTACSRCPAAWSRSARRCVEAVAREVREETGLDHRAGGARGLSRDHRRATRRTAWNAISSSCASPRAGIAGEPVLNEELERGALARAGRARRACKTTTGLAEIVAAAFERLDARPGNPMPFFRRVDAATMLEQRRLDSRSWARIIRPMLRRAPDRGLDRARGSAGARARPRSAAAPFDASLQRLAEILGALHYLRGICGANEGQKWRNEMQALIDAEAPSGERRDRMIASFNRGYRGFQQTYRTCTPAADWSFAATWRKAPRSPARSPRATQTERRPASPVRHCYSPVNLS